MGRVLASLLKTCVSCWKCKCFTYELVDHSRETPTTANDGIPGGPRGPVRPCGP